MFKAVPVSGVGDACLSTHLLNLANSGALLVDNFHIKKNIFEIYLDSSGSGDILRGGGWVVVLNSGLCPHSLSRPGVLRIMRVVAELPRWCHKGGVDFQTNKGD